MAFIGNTNTTQAFTPAVDYFSGNGSTTAFTLSRPVASVAQVQAVVNNVAQNPSDAFTVSGNTITFTSAPSSGTNNIYVYYTSPITQVIAPGQGTVGTTQLQNGLTVNFADGTAAAPSITNDGDTNTGVFYPAADTVGVSTGGSERVRVDSSGNVGIGTSSPSARVDNTGTFRSTGATDPSSGTGLELSYRSTYGDVLAYNRTSSAFVQLQVRGEPIIFGNTGGERMRIDSSGNVGIGTSSPSTYGKLAATGTSAFGVDQTDYINALGGGGTARVEAVGGNTNINLALSTKGTGAFYIWRGGYGGTNTLLIDGSSNLQFNSGYGSVATAYGCRAWVNFNGTGTVAIRASGNVSSITDNGVGDYTVNFSTAMPDANYSSVASCSPSAGPNQRVVVMNFAGATNTIVAPTSSACRFSTSALAATADVEYVHFSAFR